MSATRASKRKASEPIPSIESSSSSVTGSRPSSSAQSKDFEMVNQADDSRDPSDDLSQPSTSSKRRKLHGSSGASSVSQDADGRNSMETNSVDMSRVSSPAVTGMNTRSATRSMSGSQNTRPVLTPTGETLNSESAETPATNVDTLSENAGDDASMDVQPIRRGRPPNRGRGRGRGGRGGRGGLSRTNSAISKKIIPPKKGSGTGRGRGGRGKKTSAIRRVQAAFDRQKDLRAAYRTVSKIVRDGLIILADRNLEEMDADPHYHEEQIEYQKVMDHLDRIHAQRVIDINAKYNWDKAKLDTIKDMNEGYQRELTKNQVADLQDNFLSKIKYSVMDVINRSQEPSDPNSQDDHGTVNQDRSNYEHHEWMDETDPADDPNSFWLIDSKGPSEDARESDSARGKGSKKQSPRKPLAKRSQVSSLITRRRGLLSAENAVPDQADDDTNEENADLENTDVDADAPGSSTPALQGDNQLDEFGSFVPNRRKFGRANTPNNRIVMKQTFAFDEDEIGPRCMSAEGRIPVVKFGNIPVPKHQLPREATDGNLYFDQLYVNHDIPDVTRISELDSEEFDEELIKRHGLHPSYGIPSGAIKKYTEENNPDGVVPSTDFSKPLPRPAPLAFVNADGRKVQDTSRSARIINTEEDWSELQPKLAMQKALKAIGAFDPSTHGLATYDATARDHANTVTAIDSLLKAAAAIETAPAVAKTKAKVDGESVNDDDLPTEIPESNVRGAIIPSKPGNKSRSAKILTTVTFQHEKVEHQTLDGFRPLSPPRGIPGALEALADAAEARLKGHEMSQQAPRRSPAQPSTKFVHYPSNQTAYAPPPPLYPQPVQPRPTFHQNAPMHQSPHGMGHQTLPQPLMSPQHMPPHMPPQQHMMPQPLQPSFSRPRSHSGAGPQGPTMLPPPPTHMMGPPPHSPQMQMGPGPGPYQQYPQQMGPQHMQYHPQPLSEAHRYFQNSQDHHAQAMAHQQHMHAQQQAASRGRGHGMRELLPRPNNRGFTGPGGVNVTSQNPPPPPPPQYQPGPYPPPYGGQQGYQGPYQGPHQGQR